MYPISCRVKHFGFLTNILFPLIDIRAAFGISLSKEKQFLPFYVCRVCTFSFSVSDNIMFCSVVYVLTDLLHCPKATFVA